ncbi:coiled-coil domain-containing protein 183 isoform X2 [Rhinatrema bivittatum]|uniref:coiled-coil domain-containing protein 183 isoform X2 n=1 Tax=Rhinatrema bivittatum TaxID=194408 RepID=UPI001129D20D|nr:coiled-coil domain-containing protein 183 isoform X2 [Rhinatrema bivittatum]
MTWDMHHGSEVKAIPGEPKDHFLFKAKYQKAISIATMKVNETWNIKEHIQELHSIFLMQERGYESYGDASRTLMSNNKESIGNLKTRLEDDLQALILARKYNETTISEACTGKTRRKVELMRGTVEIAKEKLEKEIFDHANIFHRLEYEVKKREKLLEDMKTELQILITTIRLDKDEIELAQRIRQLENNIAKTETKWSAAKSLHKTYLNILDCLKFEMLHFPRQVALVEEALHVYKNALATMTQMADRAIKTRKNVTLEMSNLEYDFISERKTRETMLNIEKKRIKDIIEKQPYKRDMTKKELSKEIQSLMQREILSSDKSPESVKDQEKYEQQLTFDIDRLKNAVQCTHIWEIVGRFMAQQKTGERLERQIEERMQERDKLKERLHDLELEHAQLKFHRTKSEDSSEKLADGLDRNFEEEEGRLEVIKSKLAEKQKIHLAVQNGIDNLYMKLYGVSVPTEGADPTDSKDSYDKLKACEIKLAYLMDIHANLIKTPWVKDERIEPFLQVRELLEASAAVDLHNRKVILEDMSSSRVNREYSSVS